MENKTYDVFLPMFPSMYQISTSLDYIVFGYLVLRIAVLIADSYFKTNKIIKYILNFGIKAKFLAIS